MKKAAVIQDLSGFGRCSLTAALPVLSVLGVQCCPLATAVLTGQTGYPYFYSTDLTQMMPHYIDVWEKNGVQFDAIYSGFLTGEAQLARVREFLSHFRGADVFYLCDPVMGDDGKTFGMFSDGLLRGMQQLTRTANLLTPNLTEACLLAELPFDPLPVSSEALLALAQQAAETLRAHADKPQDIVVTGIKCLQEQHPYICNLTLTDAGVTISRAHYYDRSFSGTGDLFASVLCGCRMRGMDTTNAVAVAERFLSHSIAEAMAEASDRNDGIPFEHHLEELSAVSYPKHFQ